MNLFQVGLAPSTFEALIGLTDSPGIVLVAGPEDSGKSTTLSALAEQIEKNENAEAPQRGRPSLVILDEITGDHRLVEALNHSDAGRLVLVAMKSRGLASALSSVREYGEYSTRMARALLGILSVRLIRTICANCWVGDSPTRRQLERICPHPSAGVRLEDIVFRRGAGCDECDETGYSGLLGAFELLVMTDDMRAIMEKMLWAGSAVRDAAIANGMKTIVEDGWTKVCLGITTVSEVEALLPG